MSHMIELEFTLAGAILWSGEVIFWLKPLASSRTRRSMS